MTQFSEQGKFCAKCGNGFVRLRLSAVFATSPVGAAQAAMRVFIASLPLEGRDRGRGSFGGSLMDPTPAPPLKGEGSRRFVIGKS
jgi:hypothetical protein